MLTVAAEAARPRQVPALPSPPSAAPPTFAGAAAVSVLLFLAGGTALAVYWFKGLGNEDARPPVAVVVRPPTDDLEPADEPPLDLEPLPPLPAAPPLHSPAPPPRPVLVVRSFEPLAQRVNQAIDRGVAYLKQTHQDLSEPAAGGGRRPLRQRFVQGAPDEGLLGLTLLACGVSPRDPLLRRLTASLRQQAPQLRRTYSMSLALLFFDRLGSSTDRERIQSLALRLVAGQTGEGAWSYSCPLLNPRQVQLLLTCLRSGAAVVPHYSGLPGDRTQLSLRELAFSPPGVRRRPIRAPQSDNSNTQFALLALWAARKHGAPVGPALVRVARHFRTSQHADGSWAYRNVGNHSQPSNSCAGLLGLAVEHGLRTWPGERGGVPIKDGAMRKGLGYLGQTLSRATPNWRPRQRGFSGVEAVGDLYFFWSLERAAMVYGLRVIGDTEWYPWAAERIVAAQEADGRWQNAFGASIDTCFALLVLRRTNFASDLTTALRGRIPGQDPARRRPDLSARPGGKTSISATDRTGDAPLGTATEKVPGKLSGIAIGDAPPK